MTSRITPCTICGAPFGPVSPSLVSPFVGELVLGHGQRGVHAVYDLHTYDAEKRDALERWEKKLLDIVAPKPNQAGNVVPISASATV